MAIKGNVEITSLNIYLKPLLEEEDKKNCYYLEVLKLF